MILSNCKSLIGSALFLVLFGNFRNSFGAVVDQDLTLTSNQKDVLDKFQSEMIPLLEEDYMKKEIYLIRWLRATNFDLEKSKDMLFEHMRWRKDWKMDTIHDEDWSEFEAMYEYSVDSKDKEGKPILITPFGQWDFRQAMVSGYRKKMERYMYKLLDDAEVEIRKLQGKGKPVTRSKLLINIDGFNTVQHACVQCMTLYVALSRALDSQFPFLFDKLIMVNTPSIFEIILNVVRPVLAPATRDSMVVLGTNKRDWKSFLLNMIEEDELPFEYGGTKTLNYI